jgi:hypothetical protein
MPAALVTIGLSVQWTPPNAAVNSGNSSFQVQGPYNAQQVGQIDVQTTDIPGTIFPVQFGSISKAKVVIIKNMMSSEIGIRLNGAIANNFNLPSGGEVVYASPTGPAAVPLTAIDVVTTASPTATEQINTFVFGD